jgi:hypothetical protein
MTLPTVSRPKHEATLTGLDARLVLSPFSVADKKNLISAVSFKDPAGFIRTVADIVDRCTNLKEICPSPPLHYIEAAFIEVYARSTGGVIEASYTCDAQVPRVAKEGEEVTWPEGSTVQCNNTMGIKIPLDGVDVDFGDLPPFREHVVMLSEDVFVTLAIPSWDIVKPLMSAVQEGTRIELGDKIVLACITCVGDHQSSHTREDFTEEELIEWLDNLDADVAEKLQPFFNNIPVVRKEFDVTCTRCSTKKKIVLSGLDDFFV